MSRRLTLSIDAMGGENAPDMVVAGIDIAHKRLPDVEFLLFGDRGKIDPLLDAHPGARPVCTVHHSDQMITDDAKPSAALRAGRGSSMRLAINAADGLASSGPFAALAKIKGLRRDSE